MKTAVLCAIALMCSTAAFAQAPAATSPTQARTITLTGCVGGGTNAQPITLANAMVVPTGDANAAASPSPVPGAVSSGVTQPPPAAGAAGTSGTAAAGAAGTSGTAGATGTSGVAGATGGAAAGVGTPPVSGAAGTSAASGAAGAPTYGAAGAGTAAGSPTTGAVGTSGTIAGTAPAGSSTSSVSGYRLSGSDMSGWVGRRVQIVGSVVPAAAGASISAAGASTSASTPEFRVVSVQPVTGDCPKP